ncbi:MAG: hypothetical protein ACI9U2_002583, partial [Bradymonadia bacterium]
ETLPPKADATHCASPDRGRRSILIASRSDRRWR